MIFPPSSFSSSTQFNFLNNYLIFFLTQEKKNSEKDISDDLESIVHGLESVVHGLESIYYYRQKSQVATLFVEASLGSFKRGSDLALKYIRHKYRRKMRSSSGQ